MDKSMVTNGMSVKILAKTEGQSQASTEKEIGLKFPVSGVVNAVRDTYVCARIANIGKELEYNFAYSDIEPMDDNEAWFLSRRTK